MVMLNWNDKPSYPPIPKQVLVAKVDKIESKAGKRGSYLSWTFRIIQDPFIDRLAWGSTPQDWVAGRKLDEYIKAFNLGTSNVESEHLVGKYVRIGVETDANTGYARVENLYQLSPMDQIIVESYQKLEKTTDGRVVNPSKGYDPLSTPVQPRSAVAPQPPTFNVQGASYPTQFSMPRPPAVAQPSAPIQPQQPPVTRPSSIPF